MRRRGAFSLYWDSNAVALILFLELLAFHEIVCHKRNHTDP